MTTIVILLLTQFAHYSTHQVFSQNKKSDLPKYAHRELPEKQFSGSLNCGTTHKLQSSIWWEAFMGSKIYCLKNTTERKYYNTKCHGIGEVPNFGTSSITSNLKHNNKTVK